MASRRTLGLVLFLALSSFLVVRTEEENSEATLDSNDSENTETEDAETKEENFPAIAEENDVLVLNDENFDEVIKDKDIILVEFYAPWCGHCKDLAPKYEKAAKRMKEHDPPVPFAKVDATKSEGLASRFEVSGYPTLKVFRKGEPYDYDGPREEDGIVDYMKERADPNWKPPPESVVTLTSANFDEFINQDLVLVEFYAPWCGHCKRLAPEYEKAAKDLKDKDPPIPLGKVDATEQTELAKKFDVKGYPTLKIFRKGKAFEYKGERTQYDIVSYMQGQVGPSSNHIGTLKQVKEFVKHDDVAILGIFNNENDPLLQTYFDANNDIRDDYKFGHTFDPKAGEFFGVKKSSILLFHPENFRSKYEPVHHVFKGDSPTPADLQTFYEQNMTPLVGQITHQNSEKRYKKKPLVVVYYDVDFRYDHTFDYRKRTQFWRSKVLEVAKDYPDLTFAIAREEEFSGQLKQLGLEDTSEEVNVALFDDKGAKYKLESEDDFNVDVLEEFIEAYHNGELKPVIKSQKPPKKNTGPVTVVVGSTFNDIVMDKTKDVLIEFYAPWCGHCQQLEPTYKKLGKYFKNEKNIVIAKLDATENDVPTDFKVEGFPTIYFAPAKDKQNPKKYEGKREFDDLVKYVNENTSTMKSKEEL